MTRSLFSLRPRKSQSSLGRPHSPKILLALRNKSFMTQYVFTPLGFAHRSLSRCFPRRRSSGLQVLALIIMMSVSIYLILVSLGHVTPQWTITAPITTPLTPLEALTPAPLSSSWWRIGSSSSERSSVLVEQDGSIVNAAWEQLTTNMDPKEEDIWPPVSVNERGLDPALAHWTRRPYPAFREALYSRVHLERPENDPAPRPKFIIHIFAWRRHLSLKRLGDSLLAAYYYGQSVQISFHMDGQPADEVVEYISKFHWPHGPISIRRQSTRIGLEKMIMSAWYPVSDDEYGIFLEDDIEVSPYFFQWILFNMQRYVHQPNGTRTPLDEKLVGFSFYTPRLNELSSPARKFKANIPLAEEGIEMLMELPCSWGALYFPWTWRAFGKYYSWRTADNGAQSKFDKIVLAQKSKHNAWTRSWKRHFIDFMYARGMYMLYPNFKQQQSFSTNHREDGEHTGKHGSEASTKVNALSTKKNRFLTVPLIIEDPFSNSQYELQSPLRDLELLPVFDLFHNRMQSRRDIVTIGIDAVERLAADWRLAPLVHALIPAGRGCILDASALPVRETFQHDDETTVVVHDDDVDIDADEGIMDGAAEAALLGRARKMRRYLLFQPQMGYNNQLRAIGDAIGYALVLNRTLVLPPLVAASNTSHLIPLNDVFDLTNLAVVTGLQFVTFDTFLQRIKKGSIEKPTRMVSLRGLTNFLQPNNEFYEAAGLLPQSAIASLPSLNRGENALRRLYGQCRDQVLTFDTLFMAFDQFQARPLQRRFEYWRRHLWATLTQPLTQVVQTVTGNSGMKHPFICAHIRRGDFADYCRHLNNRARRRRTGWLRDFHLSKCYPTPDHVSHALNATVTSLKQQMILAAAKKGKKLYNVSPAIYISSDDLASLGLEIKMNPESLRDATDGVQDGSAADGSIPDADRENSLGIIEPFVFNHTAFRDQPFRPEDHPQWTRFITTHRIFTVRHTRQALLNASRLPASIRTQPNDFLPFLEQAICSAADVFIGNAYSTYSQRIVAMRGGESPRSRYIGREPPSLRN